MKKVLFILLSLFFISFELGAMEESRKRKEPEKGEEREKGCPPQQPQQPPIKRRRLVSKPSQVKTLKEIATQKLIKTLPRIENYSEILESIPAEELKQEIKPKLISEWVQQSVFEETPLHKAQSTENIDKELAFGFDPNTKDRRGRTALNALIEKGFLDAAYYLVEKKGKDLDVTSPDIFGITPLQNAIEHEDEQLAESIFNILKQNQCAIKNEISNFNTTARSALTLAIRYMPRLAEKFLNEGAYNIHATNKYGQNALMFAAKYNSSLIKPLISARANVDARDKRGKTPLMYAAASNAEAIQPLIDAGANIIIEDKKNNPALYYAIRKHNLNAITALVGAGADPNKKGTLGALPLMLATVRDYVEGVKKLLELGADPNGKNNDGLDALTIAISHNHPEIVKLLLDNGAQTTQWAIEAANNKFEMQKILHEHFEKLFANQ